MTRLDEFDEQELTDQRRDLYEQYQVTGTSGMSTLDLRGVVHHAEAIADSATEREVSGIVGLREARGDR